MAKIQFTDDLTATTPRAAAYWAKVTKVGEYGKYEIDLHLENEDANTLLGQLEGLRDKGAKVVDDAGKTGYNVADVHKGQDDQGRTIFKFKLAETRKDGTPNKIKFYDVNGKEVVDWDQLIGNESIVKVKYWARPYFMPSSNTLGVTVSINAIQVIDLVPYGTGGGFDDESGADNQDF
jgi:hypothetical protein